MAAGLTPPVETGGRGEHRRYALLAASVALLLLVGLSRPDAAQPDLLPRGWAPGPLLPLTLDPAVVTGILWGAYLVGAAAVLLGLRGAPRPLRGWVPGLLAVAALLTAPFGSADHISYVAYGRILVGGGDPWVESPISWAGGADPVTSRVEAPWTEEPSIYGPAATLLHGLSAWVGGPSLRQEVWVWQVLVVLAWLATRWALRAALPPEQHGRVDVAWTLNPLVLGLGVLGAHVDVVATAFVVVAVAVAARRAGPGGALLAGALLGLGAATKITYGIALVALAAASWLTRGVDAGGPGAARRRIGGMLAGFVVGMAALHAWAGPHVYDQLLRSRQAVSLATPWRLLLEALRPVLGNGGTRVLVSAGAALLALLFAALLLRASRPAGRGEAETPRAADLAPTALWLLAGLQLAYVLAAPYSLPWYDVLVWAALPGVGAVVPGVLDGAALARTTVAALAYVPGRVLGMTPGVEALTLGFRRTVAPWLVLALWLAVVSVLGGRGGRPGWGRRPVPSRARTPRPPTR